MSSFTFKDIIDDKAASWWNSFKKLEKQAANTSLDGREQLRAQLDQLKPRLESAVAQLHALDEQESPKNTMKTKDKILEIFDSIDRIFPHYDEQTPYML